LLNPIAAALEILRRGIGAAILRHPLLGAARIVPIQMAVGALFGKIRRAIDIAGIIGDALTGNIARLAGQARTAVNRAAAIVAPDTA